MSDQRENDISKRVRELFDHYEEDATAADTGWKLLRQRYPERRKRPVLWFWPLTTAALVLLFYGIGLWFHEGKQNVHQIAYKNYRHIDKPGDFVHTNRASVSAKDSNPVLLANSRKPASNNVTKQLLTSKNKIKSRHEQHTTMAFALTTQPYKASTKILTDDTSGLPIQGSFERVNRGKAKPELVTATIPSDTLTTHKLLANQPEPISQQKDSTKKEKPSIYTLFERDKQENSPPKEKKETNKGVIYSVYAATYFNYAKGSSSSVNGGAGFTSDISITGKLKLSTGIAIGQNSLNYAGIPTQSPAADAAVKATINKTVASYSLVSGLAIAKSFSAPAVRSYQANFTGLDIPINLKYELSSSHVSTYVLAGISSGTFISENYNYQYTNASYLSAYGTSTVASDASTHNSFSRFDFARMFNLSVGVGYPVGGYRVFIEPFLKYPLSGLGSQQIKFGAGGVNLKFTFQTRKK